MRCVQDLCKAAKEDAVRLLSFALRIKAIIVIIVVIINKNNRCNSASCKNNSASNAKVM